MEVAPSLSPDERRILAALARRPLGLAGDISVSVASGVDGSDLLAALERLVGFGLIAASEEIVQSRPLRKETVWTLCVGDAWFTVAGEVQGTPLPDVPPEPLGDRLPERFRHLFWWGDPSAIRLPRDAAFVAEQLLACHDIDAWGWAITTLPRESLERVAAEECTPPATAAMIHNALAQRCEAAV